jgi:hypothetical protein
MMSRWGRSKCVRTAVHDYKMRLGVGHWHSLPAHSVGERLSSNACNIEPSVGVGWVGGGLGDLLCGLVLPMFSCSDFLVCGRIVFPLPPWRLAVCALEQRRCYTSAECQRPAWQGATCDWIDCECECEARLSVCRSASCWTVRVDPM